MVEKMDGKFTCSGCNQEVTMEKQLLLDKAPSVAAFHLKRFLKDGDSVKKIDKYVGFSKELDLKPYTSGSSSDNVSCNSFYTFIHFFKFLACGYFNCVPVMALNCGSTVVKLQTFKF